MREGYLRELDNELCCVGIRGPRRRRILFEVEDHLLASDDPERFGEPKLIAARFADELATGGARRGAFVSFAALAPAAAVYGVLFALIRPGPDITSARTLAIGIAAAFALALAPQVSLASGLAAIACAWRLRRDDRAAAAEITFLRRRVAVALGSGAAAIAALAAYTYEYSAGLPHWWTASAYVLTAASLVPIGGAALALAPTVRLRPQAGGAAGDICDDLAPLLDRMPLRLGRHPWRFCLLFGAAVATALLVAGGLDEGPRNAVAEFGAICTGFAALGRYLGLRR